VAQTKKILVVDDEPQIVEVLEKYLSDEGFVVIKAHDGVAAVDIFKAQRPDLVLLDLKLPGESGLDAFARMRAHADAPVIILTSRGEEIDRILGLELGADDYISKPFSPREVVARVKTVLRRVAHSDPAHPNAPNLSMQTSGAADSSRRIVIGALELDSDAHEVRVGDREAPLTPTEFRILEVLAQHPGRTFSRAQLLDKAKAENIDVFDRTLDRHIANLRHKIEPDPANPAYILTVFGVGYKMAKNPGMKT
jgi:DNA-binding response OmpR family regulator